MGLIRLLSKVGLILIILVLLLPAFAVNPVTAGRPDTFTGLGDPTKIAPDKAVPPHPFTLIDTPSGRLTDGTKAVFKLNGAETVLDLKTHKPYTTAKGALPENMPGGDYIVFFRNPDGTEIEVGPFEVIGEPVQSTDPSISPTQGPALTPFTITDPLGRIESGAVASFYQEGADPAGGTLVIDVSISSDGKTLTGKTPDGLLENVQHYVSVRPTIGDPPYFGDLAFLVTF